MAPPRKTFVLGVGAQKAGTTWLSRYLRSFDFADFGACEEYHVWDALYAPAWSGYRISGGQPWQERARAALGLRTRSREVCRRMQDVATADGSIAAVIRKLRACARARFTVA